MNRRSYIPQLSVGLLLVLTFILSVRLSVGQNRSRLQKSSNSITAQLLGDSRRLFANHFFIKADEYFHKGYYPSMFDQAAAADQKPVPAMTAGALGGDAHEGEVEWMKQPRDRIERFSRHFFPSEHMHLDDGHDHDHDHDGDGIQDHDAAEHDHDHHDHHDHHDDHAHDHGADEHESNVSEILPWLQIAAELNPDKDEIYVTGAYYLRDRLNQVDEAEKFLREGWRHNRQSPAIIFELARIKEENRNQPDLARNLYKLALRNWEQTEAPKENPDSFLLMQILMRFAQLEQKQGNTDMAVQILRQLRTIAVRPDSIDRLILEYQGGFTPPTP